MRSVSVLLLDTTEAAVGAYLNTAYPERREPWVMVVNEDAYLYIHFGQIDPLDYEPEEWNAVVRRLGGEPRLTVVADVSGRHPGDEQVADFVFGLLSRFNGGAMDEYTGHLWSLAEVRKGHQVQGHPFFDYNGWFLERQLTK